MRLKQYLTPVKKALLCVDLDEVVMLKAAGPEQTVVTLRNGCDFNVLKDYDSVVDAWRHYDPHPPSHYMTGAM